MCVVCRAAGLGRSYLLRGVWFYVIMFWCDLVNNVSFCFYYYLIRWCCLVGRFFFELSLFCLMCRGIFWNSYYYCINLVSIWAHLVFVACLVRFYGCCIC